MSNSGSSRNSPSGVHAPQVISLGIALYEMLAGRRPFRETDPTALAVAHLQQVPLDVREFAPLLSPRIGWLLKRMLAKEPLRRPEVGELITLLAELELETFEERGLPRRTSS